MQPELVEAQGRPGLLRVRRPLGHARQTVPLLAGWSALTLAPRRGHVEERGVGRDPADEMDVGGEMRQDALTTISTVTEHDDLIVGEPAHHQADEFQGQFRSGAVVGIGLGFRLDPAPGRFPLAFLPLGEPLAVDVQPAGDRQGEDLGGRHQGWMMMRQSTTQSCPQLTRALDRLEIRGS